jgi:hypothetical protein
MSTDIAQCGSAQQCIGDRMQQYIRIRVPQQSMRMLNVYPPQHQRAALYQSMYIPAFANSE